MNIFIFPKSPDLVLIHFRYLIGTCFIEFSEVLLSVLIIHFDNLNKAIGFSFFEINLIPNNKNSKIEHTAELILQYTLMIDK